MKKLLLLFLGVLIALPSVSRDFEYEYEGQTLTYTVIDEDAKTCQTRDGYYDWENYKCYVGNYPLSGNLEIPEVAKDGNNEYTVVAIPEYAFSFTEITSISVPATVTSFGEYAFAYCTNLTSVTFAEGLTSIGSRAFEGCTGLTSVSIPSSVTKIEDRAFQECTNLTKAEFASIESLCSLKFETVQIDVVTYYSSNPLYYAHHLYIGGEEVTDLIIPETVTSIGDYTFYCCSGLTSVSIPSSVTSIGSDAFYGCTGLTKAEFASIESLCSIKFGSNPLSYAHHLYVNGKEVTDLVIPSSVTSIGSSAFRGCTGLTSVTFHEGVTSIDWYAFYGCTGLTSVTIPEGVTSIDWYTFSGCTGLTSVTIPESVTSIGYGAFSECTGLTSVTIPEGVTSIGAWAFSGCSGLTSVTIPESVTSIEYDAFYRCTGLTSVYYASTDPISGGSDIFSSKAYENATLYVPAEAVEKCKEINPWKNFVKIEAYDFPAGIDDAIADFDEDAPCEVYNLNGVKVGDSTDSLTPGLYIVRQGNAVKKIAVK